MKSDQRHLPEERSRGRYREQLASEAAEWVARAPHLRQTERQDLMKWLSSSPDHIKEFLLAARWEDSLKADLASSGIDAEQLLSINNVIDVTRRIQAPPSTPTSRLFSPRLRIAAACLLVAILIALVPLTHSLWSAGRYATSIGEQRSIALPDGSLVVMNTRTRLRVDYSEDARTVYLVAGQAMFSVTHDADRPFRVRVEGGVVQAIGTKFDVRRDANETTVAVVEGRVRVTPATIPSVLGRSAQAPVPQQQLSAGEGLKVREHGEMSAPTPVNLAEVNAWQQRRLVFRDDTLNTIVAEFNRYNREQIRIEDAALAQMRYSGVLDADHPEGLLNYLSAHHEVQILRKDENVLLRRR